MIMCKQILTLAHFAFVVAGSISFPTIFCFDLTMETCYFFCQISSRALEMAAVFGLLGPLGYYFSGGLTEQLLNRLLVGCFVTSKITNIIYMIFIYRYIVLYNTYTMFMTSKN